MNAGNSLGRHKLTSRFTSIVRLCSIGFVYFVIILRLSHWEFLTISFASCFMFYMYSMVHPCGFPSVMTGLIQIREIACFVKQLLELPFLVWTIFSNSFLCSYLYPLFHFRSLPLLLILPSLFNYKIIAIGYMQELLGLFKSKRMFILWI